MKESGTSIKSSRGSLAEVRFAFQRENKSDRLSSSSLLLVPQQRVGDLVHVGAGHLDEPLELVLLPLVVLVHQVDLEDVGRRVVGARRRRPLLRVDLGALQLGGHPAVLAVVLQHVVDPLAVLAGHHLHSVLEALAHVDVHHLARLSRLPSLPGVPGVPPPPSRS